MTNWKKYIPDGTKDILFEECSRKIDIENVLRETYVYSGFMEVKSPTLEFYDTFNEENSILPQEKIYKLIDSQGRILALRADMTTPIARIAGTKLKEMVHPLRLCYNSNVYRANGTLNGKNSEVTQSGIEVIGTDSIAADAEVIIIGIRALLNCGLKNFKIEIGHAKLFKALVDDLNLNIKEKEKLRRSIDSKNFTALNEILYANRDRINDNSFKILNELPKLFGGIDIIDTASRLTDNKNALGYLKDIKKVYEIVKSAGLQDYLAVDLGMVYHIDYYTGIIFRGYTHGFGGNILSGGRYDNLIGNFGDDEPATGFAIDVDGVIVALKQNERFYGKKYEKVLIHHEGKNFNEAYIRAQNLRKQGIIAEMSLFDDEDRARKYADIKNMKFIKI
ncbi:ATP phosphoribosyltransferase regulatory subunit [Clostridium luticellarii]|jgi:ATP phosphoribosyltransferase regulatory subunit|uniref:ATP phosphoribosyltransferase regulatory subunit n=1 Tax=Clostridium luticellarii TaxID=1691940 RepID=UPI002352E064|nr:ATP phosphoribosyltransferase regulatory subunit [Clostridium luticellarii]MCI1943793.1 ATP phosphoribosyltransferase regulatory subunit [Clostridium luticellarii]MCI1967054.1 ATP phosphoribosyltransferase regulatory subunit [Clostridium luticellarii]